jgi:dienelactone hydrolase
MAEVLLFHHAQGLTAGVRAFADELRAAGHVVHTPDLYDGKTFAALDEGIAYAGEVGFGAILERGRLAAERLPNELVYAGLSLGVMPAQMLTQTRPGARGAVLVSSAIPTSEFGGAWPEGVPLQIHMMADDPIVRDEGDLDVARQLAETIEGAELFVYAGEKHLFVDGSLSDHDQQATTLLSQRVLAFLDRLG